MEGIPHLSPPPPPCHPNVLQVFCMASSGGGQGEACYPYTGTFRPVMYTPPELATRFCRSLSSVGRYSARAGQSKPFLLGCHGRTAACRITMNKQEFVQTMRTELGTQGGFSMPEFYWRISREEMSRGKFYSRIDRLDWDDM